MPLIRACNICSQKNRVPATRLADTGRCGACHSPLPPVHEPIEVNAQLFDEIRENARVPVLVDFWAAWCAPCRMAAPEVARVAADMAGQAIVLKVDTDRHPELGARFNVRGIPHFTVFIGGRLAMEREGVVDHQEMEKWLRSASPAPAA